MQDRIQSYFHTVITPWRITLLEAVKTAQNNVFCVSPFFTDDVVTSLEETFLSQGCETRLLTLHILTRIRRDDFLSGASHLEAFEHILSWKPRFPDWHVELRAKDDIHAKVWVIDQKSAFIGSGNATRSGLDRNIEYGVAITNADFIQQIQRDWLPIWSQGQVITSADLQGMRMLLEAEKTDPQIQELEKALGQLRKELAQKSNLPTRLGTRHGSSLAISLGEQEEGMVKTGKSQEKIVTQLMLKLDDVPGNDNPADAPTLDTVKTLEHALPKNVLQVRIHELLSALCWISPALETEELLSIPPVGYTHHEFVWRPDQRNLYCYAYRMLRHSQAVIRVSGNSDTINWTIRLATHTLKALQIQLQALSLQNPASAHSVVLLTLDDINQQLVLSQPQEIEKRIAAYDVYITHEPSKWKYWQQSSYRITTRHTTLLKAVLDLKSMIRKESLVAAIPSNLALSDTNYRLLCTLYMGQKKTIPEEPVLKIRGEEANSDEVMETTIEGNGKKYPYPQYPEERNLSLNDLTIALQGAPEQLRHWRILLDYDRFTEFDGIKNRHIVGLQPEAPPPYLENAPDLLHEWWHMLY